MTQQMERPVGTMPAKPIALPVKPENIPHEVRERPQWVVWRYVFDEKRGDWTKVLYQANGRNASSTKPRTWTTFDKALAAYEQGGFDGIGFVFAADDGFFGVDWDACRNPETGELTQWAREIVDLQSSYTEVSPSVYGVKSVARGVMPEGARHVKKLKDVPTFGPKVPEIAVYDRERFWCMTGHRLDGTPATCEPRQKALEALLLRLFPPKAATNGEPRKGDRLSPFNSLFDRLVNDCATAPEGQRSERDFALCAAAVRRGWDRHEVWHRVQGVGKFSERGERYFNTTWERAEQAAGPESFIRSNGESTKASTSPRAEPITNAVLKGESESQKLVPIPMADVLRRFYNATGGWPRRVGSALFVPSNDDVAWLQSPAALFGWAASENGIIRWSRAMGACTKEETFNEHKRKAIAYGAIERLPHVPELPAHYYVHPVPEAGDGRTLNELLERFSPAADIDADLIRAMFATVIWGGAPGSRPAFCITADEGRGIGKSKLAAMLGHVAGGVLDFSQNEDVLTIKARLLSPDAAGIRVALLDNVKSLRFSWVEWEALVTSPFISGKQMYVGESRRPNTLLWVMTLNGASLSTDMAQRSVIIKLKSPQRSANWEDETVQYIFDNQATIVADLVAFYSQPAAALERYTRWATWERDVLARLPDPEETQAVIGERQGQADVEEEEANIIEGYFREQLADLHYEVDVEKVHIGTQVASRWYNAATNENRSVTASTRILKQLVGEKRLKRLQPNPCRSDGRGFIWSGEGADQADTVRYCLDQRIANATESRHVRNF